MDEKYSLVGVDGNAFCVMGYVANAMKKEGKSEEEIDEYYENAKAKNYNHLLRVSLLKIDELNELYR
jgi:hypothetical protein